MPRLMVFISITNYLNVSNYLYYQVDNPSYAMTIVLNIFIYFYLLFSLFTYRPLPGHPQTLMTQKGVAEHTPGLPEEAKPLGHATLVSHVHGSFGQSMDWAVAAPHTPTCPLSARGTNMLLRVKPRRISLTSFSCPSHLWLTLRVYPLRRRHRVRLLKDAARALADSCFITTTVHTICIAPVFPVPCDSLGLRPRRPQSQNRFCLTHSTPPCLNASTVLSTVPTGPPQLPFISIRAWTSYYGSTCMV